jgi:hypothetical protein
VNTEFGDGWGVVREVFYNSLECFSPSSFFFFFLAVLGLNLELYHLSPSPSPFCF